MTTHFSNLARAVLRALAASTLLHLAGCAAVGATTMAHDGSTGEVTSRRERGTSLWCAARISWGPSEPLQPGPAWRERRACAGRATTECYERLGDSATSDELTTCMAPLVEACEAEFHRVCPDRSTLDVASR